MTNLKKTIAVVLAFAMIFSMGMISTFAYSDVEASTTVGEAVGILSNLGILTGFEDGTFKPDETVTRAQMAAIVCRTLGYESQAKSSAGTTIFNDVPGDHWAAGYINVAQSLNIINGYGDGNFGPEDKVTYEQAVKMIVCALNYDLVAQAKGGYPTGYLSVASSEGITKSANGKVGDAAKRSTVAVLVYNSLEVRILDQNTWTTDGSDEYAKSDDTILSKYLEVNKWEGVVSDVPFTDYAKNDYKKNSTPKISLDSNAFYKVYKNGKETKIEDEAATNVDCSLVDVEGLLGKKVIAYIGDSEDDETGNIMVYAISEKSSGNTVTKISKTQLVDKDDKEFTTMDQISYRKTGSTKVYDLDLDSKVKIYKNYTVDSFDKATSGNETDKDKSDSDKRVMNNTEGLDQLVGQGGTIELISNDNDDDIEYIVINAYTNEGTIESVSEEDGEITFTLYNGGLDDIDTADEDVLVKVYRDGELAAAKDLAEGDTVSTVEISKNVRVLYASSKTVTGSVDSYDTEDKTVTIAGNDYELSPFKNGTVASLKDEEGTFYLNVDGQIAHNESDSAASGNYGLVLAVDKETGNNDGYVMQVVLADGTVAEYDLASKAKYYDKNGASVTTDDKTTAKKIAGFIGTGDVEAKAVKATTEKAINGVFKFTIKDGKINKIKALKGDSINYLSANTKKYDAEAMSYGSAEFDKDTVVFAIDAKYEEKKDGSFIEIKDDDVSVGEVSAFFADEDDALTFIALDEDNGIMGAVLGFDLKTSVPEDSAAVIISSIKTVTYDDDDAVQITGLQGGKEVTYTIYDEDADYASSVAPEDLAKGDVILVAAANSENVVSDFKTLYQANKSGALGTVDATAKKGDDKDDIYNVVANLNAAKTKDSNNKFYLDADVKNDYETFATTDDGLSMRASANYTLVDYTESTKNPTVEKKSSSTTLSTSAKYKTVVFVRVYDGVLAEVVAYRFNA